MVCWGDQMDLEMSREEKERLVQQVADVAFEGALNKEDALAIIETCLKACHRKAAEIEEEIRPAYHVIQ